MRSLLKAFQAEIENLAAPRPAHTSGDETRTKIFIGHGRSDLVAIEAIAVTLVIVSRPKWKFRVI